MDILIIIVSMCTNMTVRTAFIFIFIFASRVTYLVIPAANSSKFSTG